MRRVSKYSGNGNDFVIMIAQEHADRSALARTLCHRHNGVGADGLVVVLPHPEYDFVWEFYNADGSEATMCGNASRCVAHFAHEKGISKGGKSIFLTGAGVIRATVNGEYVVSDMVPPKILRRDIEEEGERWWLIDTGVPHLVAIRESVTDFDLQKARALRERYDANVNICSVDEEGVRVRTYERGVEDETLACGTGMTACFVRLVEEKMVENEASFFPKSGDELYLSKEGETYRFGGRVTKVFDAEVYI